MDRLDALQCPLWGRALAGDISAVNTVLKIIQTRIRLLGLALPDPEERTTGEAATVVLSPEQLQRWLETDNAGE
jgi:hypothetical protein